MQTILLNTDWTKVSAISTGIAAFATIIYVIFTWSIFRATSNAAKASAKAADETAKAAASNAIANELSAYLTLKADLTSEIFNKVSRYSRLNKLEITTNLNEQVQYTLDDDVLRIKEEEFILKVLNNIEDLALFHDKNVLTIETIDAGYGYSILNIGNNEAVRRWIRQELEDGSEAYAGFEKLYELIYNRLESEREKERFKPKLIDTNE